jgi:hypothetical protein
LFITGHETKTFATITGTPQIKKEAVAITEEIASLTSR